MADGTSTFDPYHRWLGISRANRPPTHYQLLGLEPGEADADVIEEAAVRQTTYLRSYQVGAHAAECTRILNEIAQARLVLLNPQKRKAYDAQLAKTAAPASSDLGAFAFDEAISPRPPRRSADDKPRPSGESSKRDKRVKPDKPAKGPPVVLFAAIGGGVLVVLVVVAAYLFSSTRSNNGPLVVEGKKPVVLDPRPDPKPLPKPDPKVDPKPDPKPVVPQPEPKPEPKIEPKKNPPPIAPTVEPKTPDQLPGLLAYWNLDEGQGTTATDSKNEWKAALKGGRWVDGVRGKAIQFEADDEYLDYSAAKLSFPAGQPFTVGVWFKTTATSGAILSHRAKTNPNPVIDLFIKGSRLSVNLRHDKTFQSMLITGPPVNDGRWHHVALSRDAPTVTFSVDGQQVFRVPDPSTEGPVTTDWQVLGAELVWIKEKMVANGNPFLRGAVDELCVFDRALTREEIRSLAARPASPEPVAPPLADIREYYGDWETPEVDGLKRQLMTVKHDQGGWRAYVAMVQKGKGVVAHGQAEDIRYDNGVLTGTVVYETKPADWPKRYQAHFRFSGKQILEETAGEKPQKFTYQRMDVKELDAAYSGVWLAAGENGWTYRWQAGFSHPWFWSNFTSIQNDQPTKRPCDNNRIRGKSFVFDIQGVGIGGYPSCDRIVMTAQGDHIIADLKGKGQSVGKLTFTREGAPKARPEPPPGLSKDDPVLPFGLGELGAVRAMLSWRGTATTKLKAKS